MENAFHAREFSPELERVRPVLESRIRPDSGIRFSLWMYKIDFVRCFILRSSASGAIPKCRGCSPKASDSGKTSGTLSFIIVSGRIRRRVSRSHAQKFFCRGKVRNRRDVPGQMNLSRAEKWGRFMASAFFPFPERNPDFSSDISREFFSWAFLLF